MLNTKNATADISSPIAKTSIPACSRGCTELVTFLPAEALGLEARGADFFLAGIMVTSLQIRLLIKIT